MKADKRGGTQITNSQYLDYAVPAAMNPLPSGVEQESWGDAEVMQDVFSGFAGVLGTAVLFIYAVAVPFDWRGFADANCDEKFDFVARLGDYESAVRQADV